MRCYYYDRSVYRRFTDNVEDIDTSSDDPRFFKIKVQGDREVVLEHARTPQMVDYNYFYLAYKKSLKPQTSVDIDVEYDFCTKIDEMLVQKTRKKLSYKNGGR